MGHGDLAPSSGGARRLFLLGHRWGTMGTMVWVPALGGLEARAQ